LIDREGLRMSLNLFSLDGRVALVTGGNGGLGRAVARGLAAAGAQVAVTGRDEAKNSDAAGEFGTERVFRLDVREEAAVERAMAAIIDRFGNVARSSISGRCTRSSERRGSPITQPRRPGYSA
jgi:NAD(P)-dependent dehydrogenase (short-subunit alcohol dehydrogenase family)